MSIQLLVTNESKWNKEFSKVRCSFRFFSYRPVVCLGIIITVFGFLLTWTPYAVAFFISVFYAQENSIVSPLVTFICACFAKSSVMWIPVLYISTSTQFRLTFVDRPSVEKYLSNPSNGGDGKNASIVNKNNDKIAAIPTITVPANT